MRIKLPISVSNQEADQDFVRYSSQLFEQIAAILNGEVSLTENCKATLVTVVFQAANAQQSILHRLGRTPVGYWVVGSAGTGVVYDGLSGSNTQYLFLRCSTAETKRIMIF